MQTSHSLPPLAPKFEFIPTNGIRLHCAIQGPEQPPARGTVLMVHGFPEFWYCWKNQIPEFARDFRVVAPDLRGFNLSDKPEGAENYKQSAICKDLLGLIDALGEKQVDLVAHDWGGAVAWLFAARYPERVKRLVILNAPHPSTFARELIQNPRQQLATQYMNLFRTPRAEEIMTRNDYAPMKKFVFGTLAHPGAMTEEDRARYIEAWKQPGALTGGLNYYRAMPAGPPDLRNKPVPEGRQPIPPGVEVPKVMVNVPTLVIWGMNDQALLPELLEGLEEYVPNLKIHRVPKGTHWVQHEEPEEVNRAMREFLGG